MKPKLVVVLGPTAVGKSDVVQDLAAQIDAEIISADSQQVYRHMNIGTAKPSTEQRKTIAHHLIDIVEPDEEFNAAMFRRFATDSAKQIARRGKQIIVCGGTGLYIKALTRGLFVGPGRDSQIRRALQSEIVEKGIGALYLRLEQVDPASAFSIHPNDRQRITRALEVYQLSGRKISEWQKEHGFREGAFDVLKIGLNRPRPELYDLIDRRCERMITAGLVDEVKGLVAKGYSLNLKAMQSVGYRHAGLFLQGEMGLDDAVALMKRDTRRLAKRQLTWFRGDKEIRWFHPEAERKNIEATTREFLD
ncbi:MAG: tRNA (adenosine(37)-N6)-dimethylallyltransferase MiaA [Deltaproteobacteria bacterium]|nr:tRNA (adenosine(37)-N6)-dimethylallyltransferase MiaA [Deltaproteobacteria bacterium]